MMSQLRRAYDGFSVQQRDNFWSLLDVMLRMPSLGNVKAGLSKIHRMFNIDVTWRPDPADPRESRHAL